LPSSRAKIWGHAVVGIDHVESTSLPGLAVKDCLDIQARMVHGRYLAHSGIGSQKACAK
jgi:GrpB-like predicted nucleotidyltransferase (UPF0157 family)